MRFEPSDPRVTPASDLLAAMLSEMYDLYGPIDGQGGAAVAPDELEPPGGVYLVGWDDAAAVAGGGLRRLTTDVAEIKRMYVCPDARGRGVARQLLAALEDAALAMGYRRVRLDTGPLQPTAQRLYEDHGYVPIPDYNRNRHASFWGEKPLAGR